MAKKKTETKTEIVFAVVVEAGKIVPFFSTYHAGKGAYARVVGKIPESVLMQYATRVEIPDLPALAHAEGRRFTQRVVGGEEP